MVIASLFGLAQARLHAHPRWRWLALAVVAGGMMLAVVNVSIVNVALPDMAADMGSDITTVSWVVAAFLVTQATLIAIAGRAGDLYGRRRVFMVGVVVLSAASVLCAVAWSPSSLIAFRVLQALGSCAMAPTAYAYAAELFGPSERGAALGVMGGILGLAPLVALSLAGLLVEGFGWRSVFWLSPPIGAVVLLAAALVLPEIRPARADRRFDLIGAVLAACGLCGILLALSRGQIWGWATAATLGAAALGVVSLGAFLVHELRTPTPMIDLSLLRSRAVATANLAALASSSALFGVLLVLPFVFTSMLGFGPGRMAIATAPVAAAFVLVSPVAGRLMAPVGSNRLAGSGFALAAIGALAMLWGAGHQSYAALAPGLCVFGVGLAMSSAAITATAIHGAPQERLGVAAALPNISRYTGGALGSAVLSAVLYAAVPGAADGAQRVADGAVVAQGLEAVMWVAAAMLAVASAAAWRMPRLPRR